MMNPSTAESVTAVAEGGGMGSTADTGTSPLPSNENQQGTTDGTGATGTGNADDITRQAIILEFEKAAIDQIQDEKYWDNLMERARVLNVIHDPAIPSGPSQEEISLFGAVRGNKIEQVRQLLESGEGNPSQQNENGTYPIHFACISNFLTIAKLLKEYGASVTVSNNAGLTPLHCAVDIGGSLKLCIWLVSAGANVNAASITGKTPLHCTCLQGFYDIAQWLIKKGADVNALTNDGTHSLHFAAYRGNIELVQLLLDHNAPINHPNQHGETPFHWACDRGHLELATFLFSKGANAYARCNLGHTALHFAALNGHLDVVIYLIQTVGLDVNCTDNDMGTALHCACQRGHRHVVDYLLQAGASMNILTSSKVSALHSACDGGNISIVGILCDGGLEPTNKDSEMRYFCALHLLIPITPSLPSPLLRSPLHYASYRGHLEVVKWFHENFENIAILVCATNKKGSNCLHVACQKGHLELAKFLIQELKVPINCQNNSGNTPFHMVPFPSSSHWLTWHRRVKMDILNWRNGCQQMGQHCGYNLDEVSEMIGRRKIPNTDGQQWHREEWKSDP
jgi:ankyrin repeat protein